jgi:hypothetical protein
MISLYLEMLGRENDFASLNAVLWNTGLVRQPCWSPNKSCIFSGNSPAKMLFIMMFFINWSFRKTPLKQIFHLPIL